ncbi:hypothetical protein TNCT_580151 [Trichonephila clavata]|uniref:Uncharacterized protein n=1 Tax=Trichonephila clavata TaxID=2740835 RepID=A0A8X6IBI0_TRICU|nr:hypothetical protein TNCT_580151 [Trichonephila clavata]
MCYGGSTEGNSMQITNLRSAQYPLYRNVLLKCGVCSEITRAGDGFPEIFKKGRASQMEAGLGRSPCGTKDWIVALRSHPR